MLSAVDEAAAQANDLVRLFRSDGRYPDITRCRQEVQAAEDTLQVTCLLALHQLLVSASLPCAPSHGCSNHFSQKYTCMRLYAKALQPYWHAHPAAWSPRHDSSR